MIYKVIPIQYYPSGLGTSYNCTVNDEKQTNVTTTLSDGRVYLYDISNAQNTSVDNNNTVSVYLNRTSGSINLSGYSYTSNNISRPQLLGNVTSTTLTIDNLRDPGAKIIFYGGGTGTITTTGVNYSKKVEGGRTFTIKATYNISVSTFTYPNNSNVTVTVTPTYTGSGSGLDSPNYWTHYWTVNFNGISQTNYSISGNGNTGAGSFTFKCPYDTKWTVSSPKIEVYCSRISAYYEYEAGGSTVTHTGFRVNKGGYQNPYTGEYGVTGTDYSGNTTFIPYGDYPNATPYGSGTWDTGYGIVQSQYGESYTWTEQQGGSTYWGYISYP